MKLVIISVVVFMIGGIICLLVEVVVLMLFVKVGEKLCFLIIGIVIILVLIMLDIVEFEIVLKSEDVMIVVCVGLLWKWCIVWKDSLIME